MFAALSSSNETVYYDTVKFIFIKTKFLLIARKNYKLTDIVQHGVLKWCEKVKVAELRNPPLIDNLRGT
jgi:hypothetical protein